ncbi:hypothetical protein YB2330_005101 [Saitoella coloradoensis]
MGNNFEKEKAPRRPSRPPQPHPRISLLPLYHSSAVQGPSMSPLTVISKRPLRVVLALLTFFVFLIWVVHGEVEEERTLVHHGLEIEGPSPRSELEHLIVVPGHSVWMGPSTAVRDAQLGTTDEEWALESFQLGQDSGSTFLSHIEKAIELLKLDTKALLVFSGGQTRTSTAGVKTEAGSYHALAEARGLLKGIEDRVTTEEYALDSGQNVAFSVCRFNEITGAYPTHMTVVGHAFKAERFGSVHRIALGIPEDDFTYIGVEPVGGDPVQMEDGEERTLKAWKTKEGGCAKELVDKRKKRNGGRRRHGYELTCPAMKWDKCGL